MTLRKEDRQRKGKPKQGHERAVTPRFRHEFIFPKQRSVSRGVFLRLVGLPFSQGSVSPGRNYSTIIPGKKVNQ